MSKVPAVA